ncbi:MAG: YHS domain-containing (seleno)protein [Sulfitobacter sp.]|jgi:YHS domain-containing protein|nr:YHS domain-containing (seleno)protein [Sulfitobacter sp.]
MNRFSLIIAAAATAVTFAGAAFAGEQYVDGTGFAVSGYDVVAYFDLPQSAVGTAQPQGIPGRADITAEYNGATFAFSTAQNRDTFVANPAQYAPQFDGHCAYGVFKGGKAPGNPNLWRIVDGSLYLNVTKNVVGFWEADIPGHINTAEGNWVSLEPTPATDRMIPQFTSAAPLK